MSRYRFFWMGLTLALGLAGPAVSQDTGAVEEPSQSAREAEAPIEEMVVTVQKREANLQDVAVSVTAFSAEDITELGISNAVDLTSFTPNLNIQRDARGTGFFINSRGIARADTGQIGADHATGIYVDGVYNGITVGSLLDVLDLERIEVLRGPQGTLWGRNTTGGAINFITRKPSGQWGIQMTSRLGNRGRWDVRTTFDFPIWGGEGLGVCDCLGTLSGMASLATLNRDAWYDNHFGRDTDENGRLAGRVALRWDLGPLVIDYAWDRHRIRESSLEQALTHVFDDPAGALVNGQAFAASGGAFGVDIRPFTTYSRPTHLNIDTLGDSTRGTDGSNDDRLDVEGHSLVMNWDLGELPILGDALIRSVTGYRDVRSSQSSDRDGTPFDIFFNRSHDRKDQFSQDLNLIGTTMEGRFEYVLGAFYFEEDGRSRQTQEVFEDPQFDSVGFGPVTQLIQVAPGIFFPVTLNLFGDIGQTQLQLPKVDNQAIAFYGHFGYTPPILEDRLKLEFGIRYTKEHRKAQTEIFATIPGVQPGFAFPNVHIGNPFTGCPAGTYNGNVPGCPGLGKIGDTDGFSAWTPSAKVSYRWTDDFMTYFSWARGFNSGGFNVRAGTEQLLEENFEEETVDSWEAGFKLDAFENRLRVNAAGFFQEYDDMQRTVLRVDPSGVIASAVLNAGQAQIWGAELEVLAQPTERLTLNLGYGLSIGKFIEFLEFDAVQGRERNFAGERDLANVPQHQFNVGIQYLLGEFAWGDVIGRVDYYWQDDTCLQNCDEPLASQNEYGLLNGRLAIHDFRVGGLGGVELALWGRNLLDRKYKPFGIDFQTNTGGQLPWIVQGFGEGRTYGVELVWRFGSFDRGR